MSNDKHIRVIEIEGHKFEIDTRTAKKIESYRVGDRVKLLTKNYSGYESHSAVIVGIDAFNNLPTIVIAYIDNPLSSAVSLKFCYLNSQSKDTEICPMCEDDLIPTRDTIRMHFDHAIDKLMKDVEEVKEKKEYFLRAYGATVASEWEPAGKCADHDDESIF
jgi:hypothetical protein